MRKCTYFYATSRDFLALMDLVEAEESFVYAVHPDMHSPEIHLYDHARAIPDPLRLVPGRIPHDLFLVPPGTEVRAASYRHISGTRYSLRPPEFSAAVVIRLFGEHPAGPLIRSQFWGHGTAPETLQLERTLFRHMRRTFRNVRGPKLGAEAYAQLLSGRRLTFDVKAPPELDLRPDQIELQPEHSPGHPH
ncbi:hypothetical protein [Flavimaricola marinus]|uniref:Uncharacterized protein n=1 Tax=Flavimaricola marinus TaxID=1819565 RepID=A0A238LAY9_9RHOB|nr:hypothetical protein [Flavimaricola marinus]SMY06136.1 hypothetical protein LOM8899_00257 [Flavimaricola marinus]